MRMSARLPTHLEVGALIRAVESSGGFAMVLQKGERDAGSLSVVAIDAVQHSILYERMPQADGSRNFVASKIEDTDNQRLFSDYLARRCEQDRDMWLIEVNIADAERFIATLND